MLFDVIPENFFGPLAAPGKIVYWECICRLFSVTSRQLSFGVERDVLVDELQYYFESTMSADIPEEELEGTGSMTSRDKANFMLRRLESYGWIYIDVDYSYVQRVNFRDYAVQIIKTLMAVSEERRAEYQGYIYTIYNLARASGTNPGRMDEILDEINKKNTRYQRAAINRARFLLSSSEDIRGQLKDILTFMNEYIQERNLDYNVIYELEEMDRLIKVFYWDYLDTDSLYAPVEGKKEFVLQEIQLFIPDKEARDEKRKKMQLKLEKTLSPEKITSYVKEQLGDKKSMLASELPLSEGDTFIKMIYIRLYGQRKRVAYRLELKDIIEKNGFRFRDFVISLKE